MNDDDIIMDDANTSSTPSKFIIDTDYVKILKKDLKSINCSVESNPAEIWEKLNSKCHKLFGYSDKIKIDKVEDLEWAKSILPAYIHWDIISDYHVLIEIWITKINKHMQKQIGVISPTSSTSEPLSFAPLTIVKGKAKEVIECNVIEVNSENETESMYLKYN